MRARRLDQQAGQRRGVDDCVRPCAAQDLDRHHAQAKHRALHAPQYKRLAGEEEREEEEEKEEEEEEEGRGSGGFLDVVSLVFIFDFGVGWMIWVHC